MKTAYRDMVRTCRFDAKAVSLQRTGRLDTFASSLGQVAVSVGEARAYGLLLAPIRDPDPVVFLEPQRIYRALKEAVPDDGAAARFVASVAARLGRGG